MAEAEETVPLTSKQQQQQQKGGCPCSKTVLVVIVIVAILVLIAIIIPVAVVVSKNNRPRKNSTEPEEETLTSSVRVENIMSHLKALQDIGDANTNSEIPSRSVDDQYNASASYVQEKLDAAGYKTWIQIFVVPVFNVLAPAVFKMTANDERVVTFVEDYDFSVMRYSGNGSVTGEELFRLEREQKNNNDDNGEAVPTGCYAADFEKIKEGSIALLPYNTNCTYYQKARLAEDAGATAVIFYYEDEEFNTQGPSKSRVRGDELNETVSIPVISLSYPLSRQFGGDEKQKGDIIIETSTSITMSYTYNLFAETPYGRGDRLIVVGSHLDSVQEGVGMNDNGSGSSTNLEIAIQIARLNLEPVNKVRFAWWGAEELGLLGSKFYTSNLTEEEIADHALNLNFDMVGSPNYLRGVYNGSGFTDGSDEMKYACGKIQEVFEERFAQQNLSYSIVQFTGRSDYGPFIDAEIAIPAGGLSTGADGLKTTEERNMYGGLANAAFDTCYHMECDTIDNVDQTVLGQMADASAYTLQKLMYVKDLKSFLSDVNYKEDNSNNEKIRFRKRRAVRIEPIYKFQP
ncbi:aminopeptidase-like [Corticium candelabrum]|uniref:aminopeptidase-like n=1 Tax=Corticium candelabrum TaxID=121492 RepID=UPI002E26CEFF|nr:aminopeptidase-like [Corticium candelabrum]